MKAKSPEVSAYRSDFFKLWKRARPIHDGMFVVAVHTTGIYCRPTCSAKRPNAKNVDVFSLGQEALNSGFRPCKICYPDKIQRRRVSSPIGVLEVVASHCGIRAVEFVDESRNFYFEKSHSKSPLNSETERHLDAAEDWLKTYFNSNFSSLPKVAFDFCGTQFDKRVWNRISKIEMKKFVSYGEMADRLNRKGAARAIGGAVGRNPIGIIVPCHRVLGKNAEITGYAGGIERKKWLLEHEGLSVFGATKKSKVMCSQ